MNAQMHIADERPQDFKTAITGFCIAVVFGIAFGYIEAAVVVYLREIFYTGGFVFPPENPHRT